MKIQALINIIQDMLLNSIGVLKDEEFQRDIWFRRNGPEVSTYIDTACHFFDTSASIFKDPSCVDYLGEEIYSKLKKLHDLLKDHVHLTEDRISVDELEEDDLLNDPNWHDIQALSEDVYNKLTEFIKRHSNE